MRTMLSNRIVRVYLLLLATVAILAAVDGSRILSASTVYAVMQQFATLGPVALALGMTILVRNFDLSVGGVVALSGCVAVIAGATNPWLGLLAALATGATFGFVQGSLIVKLNLSSIGVTLGGLLTATGLAYVVTGNQEIALPLADIPALLDQPLWGPFSLRCLVAVVLFAMAALAISLTRPGRDLLASGSDPKAAMVAGVRVATVVTATFVIAGMCSAIGGALLSFSLAAASPTPLSNPLVPAAAAAIIGGVSLRGGRGHPIGIAGGVLVLAVLQSGLTALGVDPFAQDVVTGAVLLIVGLLDGLDFRRRSNDIQRHLHLGAFRAR